MGVRACGALFAAATAGLQSCLPAGPGPHDGAVETVLRHLEAGIQECCALLPHLDACAKAAAASSPCRKSPSPNGPQGEAPLTLHCPISRMDASNCCHLLDTCVDRAKILVAADSPSSAL